MLAVHLMLRLSDDRVLAPTRPARIAVAHAVFATVPPAALLAFRAADTHLHVEMLGDEDPAREVARRLKIALQRRLQPNVPFNPPRVKPILDQWHLQEAFGYVLRQHTRHGIDADTFHEAGNLPDLLGARVLGAHTLENMKGHLPRVPEDLLHEILGFRLQEPASVDLGVLAEAASAVVGRLELGGHDPEIVQVRAAAVHLVRGRHSDATIATALGVADRTVRRLSGLPRDARLIRAVALQASLRARC